MKFTNKHKLPRPVARALAADDYQRFGDFSATELGKPPQIVQLCHRHDEDIVVEVMDNIWSLQGRALHYVMSLAQIEGSFVEERFLVDIDGVQVSMQSDYVYPIQGLEKQYAIIDHKNTSRYAIKEGVKKEWEEQINVYIYGWKMRGFSISTAHVVAWLRDWSHTEAHVKKTYGYPKTPIVSLDVNIWPASQTLQYLRERIKLHQDAQELPDHELPHCTLEERWGKPDRFAAEFIEGKSKGKAVPKGSFFSTAAECDAFIEERRSKATNKGGTIKAGFNDAKRVYHRGQSIRCERYCSARPFCHQYKTLIKKRPF